MTEDNGNHAAPKRERHMADIYTNPLTPRALELVKERDRLRAINAELVEGLEGMVDEFISGGGQKRAWLPWECTSLKTARAALDKARKEGLA